MDLAHRNRVHERLELALAGLNVGSRAIYFEDKDDHIIIAVFFKRVNSKNPTATHRIDIWANEVATVDELTAALMDAFEEEWRQCVEDGWD